MTIIAYKDGIIAVDRCCIESKDLVTEVTKYHRYDGDESVKWLAFSGSLVESYELTEWYKLKESDQLSWPKLGWPSFQSYDSYTSMIVADSNSIQEYEHRAYPIEHDITKPLAFGTGKAIALGAMHAGASAVDAVKITCDLCSSCGIGIDVIDLQTNVVYRKILRNHVTSN